MANRKRARRMTIQTQRYADWFRGHVAISRADRQLWRVAGSGRSLLRSWSDSVLVVSRGATPPLKYTLTVVLGQYGAAVRTAARTRAETESPHNEVCAEGSPPTGHHA